MWQTHWDQAEQEWNQRAQEAAKQHPLRGFKNSSANARYY